MLVQVRGSWSRGHLAVNYTLASRRNTNDRWYDRSTNVNPASEDFGVDYGPASADERHRLVVFGDVELAGFTLSLKGVYASAHAYTALTGTDDNGDGALNDRPSGEGRNARLGPDYRSVDLGIRRHVQLGRADAALVLNCYNLLNRTNLVPESVVGNLQSPGFGRATRRSQSAR